MCDEFTAKAEDAALASRITRGDFTAAGAAVVLAACSGAGEAKAPRLRESTVRIATPDGTADAFFVHPAKGKHPAVILWPDVGGLRDAKMVMARRLAGAGALAAARWAVERWSSSSVAGVPWRRYSSTVAAGSRLRLAASSSFANSSWLSAGISS